MSSHIQPLQNGLVNLPGSSATSIALVQHLLKKDYEEHHCFWTNSGLHNHLPHHLLAAHDLGAPPAVLQAIFDNEVGMQQPLRQPGSKTPSEKLMPANWTTRIGKAEAYADYLDFFSAQIATKGIAQVMQQYVFAASANGNGTMMLIRLVSGLMHPFIQLGYGIEFGQDFMVASGLAQAAVTLPGGVSVFEMHAALPTVAYAISPGPSLLELLREVYESPLLVPVMPYDPDALMSKRLRDWMSDPKRAAEIRRIYGKWSLNPEGGDAEIEAKVRECIAQATLLLASTSKPDRMPRADFFLMHYLTGALFLPTVLKALDNMSAKAQLLNAYVRVAALILMLRGRPRINVPLLMSCTAFPGPPPPSIANFSPADPSALGTTPTESNPWLSIAQNALHHPEEHVPKAVRALYYAAQQYGYAAAGELVPAFDASGAEIHDGLAKLDGTVFIRAAGFVSNVSGWVVAGQKGGDYWDRSGLGWEEAWGSSD
ncbi:hypothetical protein C8R47DRAFT_1036611 [Mycena vitilis]|nr:hypothetical protein C8R47DRAFT_1036611 [Mycena vitilis]